MFARLFSHPKKMPADVEREILSLRHADQMADISDTHRCQRRLETVRDSDVQSYQPSKLLW